MVVMIALILLHCPGKCMCMFKVNVGGTEYNSVFAFLHNVTFF
jgi:hypothetical protein